jgi:S-adenosylmethionine:tRNA ribosyltransferase-isomerase
MSSKTTDHHDDDCRCRTYRRPDFHYELPEDLIAQSPAAERGGGRLLALTDDGIAHLSFEQLPGMLRPDDLVVVNDTRVVKARLAAEKDSGGRAEILLERVESERIALCQVRVSKPLKPGRELKVGPLMLRVQDRQGPFYRLEFPEPVLEVLDRLGTVPLPPYIDREPGVADADRYQTLWGRVPGAVAAPTAGLHFSESLLAEIRARTSGIEAVTLHVGSGTFTPVRVDDLSEHRMHGERLVVTPEAASRVNETRARGGKIVAVGTTVVRALESAADHAGRVTAGERETELFITPGYQFRSVDALVTNFHLPESTLLMLVCAFGGYERVMEAYRTAVAERYRFFSYGDAMFLEARA